MSDNPRHTIAIWALVFLPFGIVAAWAVVLAQFLVRGAWRLTEASRRRR